MGTGVPTKKVLLVMGDGILSEMISLMARRVLNVEIHRRSSTAAAISYLKNARGFELIIADDSFPKGAASRMHRFIQESKKMAPVVGIFDEATLKKDPNAGKNLYAKLDKSKTIDQIIGIMEQFFPKRKKDDIESETYISINLEGLLSFNKLGCDCFIKISDEKFLKVLNNGDYFGKDDYDKYKSKGLEELFLPTKDTEGFVRTLSENLRSMDDLSLYSSPESLLSVAKLLNEDEQKEVIDQLVGALNEAEKNNLSFDDGVKVVSQTVDTMAKAAKKFGPTPELQKLAKATVILSIHTLKNSPELNDLFEKAEASEDNYLSDHSVMLANISCMIAGLLGWNSNLTYYKLTLAALIHDLTLQNSALSKFRVLPDLMLHADEFEEIELEVFVKHTETAAELVRTFRMIPPDVDIIVGQHHERPDGTGFPSKINYTTIAPLSAVMIVAHDLVSYIMNRQKKDNWNMVSFLNQHRLLYQYGVFKDIFTAMWNQLVNANQSNTNKAA